MEEVVIQELEKNSSIPDTGIFARERGLDHSVLVDSVLKSLIGREIVEAKPISHEYWIVTEEGQEYASRGSPELQTFQSICPTHGTTVEEIQNKLGTIGKLGIQQCLKRGWLKLDKETKKLFPQVTQVMDETAEKLRQLALNPQATDLSLQDVKELKSRKLVQSKTLKTFCVQKGRRFSQFHEQVATDLSKEMIESGSWRSASFKEYNFEASGKALTGGFLHPLMKVREQIRYIFLGMGFEEMPTNQYVESSFWNFDALFQPQQHPARDAHDTFFLSDPAFSKPCKDREYVHRVCNVHQQGAYGSLGYRYPWSEMESQKNILRTHTTAISSKMLYHLAQKEDFVPKKYFSIDRVFRNENLDATHLAEFHQIEGLIADRNLTIGDLKGVIHYFFSQLGMSQLKFKPTYNPYTEPSMEIFAFHQGLGKWVEVGNSGVFRPEMLLPMKLPEDVTIIAWGLSLERPTMILYGVRNIRELFGHKVDIEAIQNYPLCRLGIE
ncbi:Phenylalanine--tRNA ligase alpha subunit, cytoplasmic [Galdieria sulphuraria]|nr:Phenylalanine--tRNA ligase alpha subunit, cytoplasmic [Galdieria sulphuraria]